MAAKPVSGRDALPERFPGGRRKPRLHGPAPGAGPLHRALRSRIAGLGDRIRPGDPEALLDLVAEIGEPGHFLPLLREIMSSGDLLRTIARRSYRHVNHFDKIVLAEAEVPEGFRLTAHLWTPPYSEAELSDELIHDHRFSFWSAILVGTLRSRNFSPDPEGDPYRNYQYTPENASAENFYAFKGSCRLKPSELVEETAGNTYFLPFTQTHKVLLPRRDLVCTLVLRSPRARDYSNVYNTSYPATDTSVSNLMFDEAELFGRLARLYAAIESRRAVEVPGRWPARPAPWQAATPDA